MDNIIKISDFKNKKKSVEQLDTDKTHEYQISAISDSILTILDDTGYDISQELLLDDLSTIITLTVAMMNRNIGAEDPYIEILDEFREADTGYDDEEINEDEVEVEFILSIDDEDEEDLDDDKR